MQTVSAAAATRRALVLALGSLAVLGSGGAAQDDSSSTELTSTFTLFHRSLSGAGSSAWEPRAQITLTDRTTSLEPYLPPSASYEDLLLSSGSSGSVRDGPIGRAEQAQALSDYYQLLLVQGTGAEAIGRSQAEDGPLTSVKKCHLVSSSATLRDELVLQLASSISGRSRRPTAIAYSIPGLILGSDACPLLESGPYAKRWTELEGVNTTLRVGSPVFAAEPPLRAPIPVKQDGTPDTPPPEKSFLQKYWMYLLPILILMFIPSEAEHSGSAEHDSSSNRAPLRELTAQQKK
ncbi:unnamed protein product [Tilletia controversa]|nr:unnamed protein product [Tilletia controversa]CAD6933780.1 unnamed protein product [Tilletia controversa]